MKSEIHPLADHPEDLPLLSAWFFSEWNTFDGRSRDQIETQLRQNLSRDSIPITFIARYGAQLIGTVSLDLSDLPGFDQLSPWLASLFVAPDFRGAGIGRALILHLLGFARAKRIPTLYLWTPGSTRLYERCGWRAFETTTYGGQPVTLMCYGEGESKTNPVYQIT